MKRCIPSFLTPLVYYLATVSFTPIQLHNFVIIPKTLGSPHPRVLSLTLLWPAKLIPLNLHPLLPLCLPA